MRFSILLPTRNRLNLLREAVESVQRQDKSGITDWEIVISDNFSDDDIAGYVRGSGDPRIRYSRTERVLPVTENWNRALQQSTGDYVLMLGDDDGLMPDCLRTLSEWIDAHENPDAIYTGAYLFTHPGVLPTDPEGLFHDYSYAEFIQRADEPVFLSREYAHEMVRAALDFRARYGFNMQFVTIRRSFVESMADCGAFFQSPFPDYYAMNAILLRAERLLVCRRALVVIGISTKSYGFYHYNQLEAAGVEFLNGPDGTPDRELAERLERVLLPGTNINTSWLLSMEVLRARFGDELPGPIGYDRYRLLQTVYVLRGHYIEQRFDRAQLQRLWGQLRWSEKLRYAFALRMFLSVIRWMPERIRVSLLYRLTRAVGQFQTWYPSKMWGGYQTLRQVIEHPPAGLERQHVGR